MQIWERYRDQFPVTERLIYLNHAAVAPLCRRAAEAMQGLAQDALDFGSEHYQKWMDTYQGVRDSMARMINAAPGEIAIVKNTSEGIATVATGIAWKRGDIVVAFEEEFPSNFYPWKRLEASGIEVRWLSIFDDLERINAACKGARMLAVSYVQYLSGYRVDLEAIGGICSRHGCFFLVDAIQGLGAFPIDVRAAKIDALSADGHKWLLGPEGCGVLYVRQEVQDEIEPMEFGWTNVAKYYDYASRDMALRADAGRYECGTLNTIGCYGLRASTEFLLEVGVENTAPAIQALGDRIHDGVTALGFETLGRRSAATGAGIVSFRKPGVECQLIVRKLKDANIIAAPRQGWVRTAPHFYIAPEEVYRMLGELKVF
jgi:cysteine desulfurase/selenocysteine lyase